jgi:hypothetical protein
MPHNVEEVMNRQQRRRAARARRRDRDCIPIKFGIAEYAPGTPADTPAHFWACDCEECKELPMEKRAHGPFHTEEEARADCEKVVSALRGGKGRLTTEEGAFHFVEENGELVLYVEKDFRRIAKRYSGGNWIILEPGYKVSGSEPGTDYSKLVIEFDPYEATQSH